MVGGPRSLRAVEEKPWSPVEPRETRRRPVAPRARPRYSRMFAGLGLMVHQGSWRYLVTSRSIRLLVAAARRLSSAFTRARSGGGAGAWGQIFALHCI